jgi:eukaryotic-like serine/threonine-protein kinase
MEPELWNRVEDLFHRASELEPGRRAEFLQQACGNDETLRREVESLLALEKQADHFIELPALEVMGRLAANESGIAAPPEKIGPYRIVREIGRGGMAVVYLAERDDQNYRSRVAIKMVKPGIGTDPVLERFRNERQTLAALDHPNIVKLLDGGRTGLGLPYLVMEHVEGLAIDRYCDLNKLSIDSRLRLFRTVCSAVQYAHQNLVIHRDLKPGNILVTKDGVPRLLDFGIAKLLNPECMDTPLVTRMDWRLMTPEYASPEQVRGQPVTSGSDIYSLGVILYEILTGHRPFEIGDRPWSEIERVISDQEPARPSTRVSADKQHLLRGDLDSIAMKALEKDPSRRYATAYELSADIGRYLSHETVIARPATAVYRARKYVRRHPFGVAVAAGLVLLLGAFSGMQSMELRRITRERDRANRVTEFMEGMFRVSDPSETHGSSVTAREILDKASNNIDTGLARDPELQAEMMYVMGMVYRNLGLFPSAQSLLGRSAEIRRGALGPQNADTLQSMHDLGWTLNLEGRLRDAEKLQRETVDARRRVFGEQSVDTIRSMSNLAWTLDREGNYAEAEKLQRTVLDGQRRLFKTDNADTAKYMNNLAATLGHQGRYAEAEKMKRDTLEIRRRILGPEHPDTLTAMNNLAYTLQQEGHYPESEKLQRETLGIQKRVLGPEHPDTLRSMNNLANTLVREGQHDEALELQRQALATKQRVLGPEHQDTLWAIRTMAENLQQMGQYQDAERLQREALEIQRRVLGPDGPETLETMTALATTLRREGQYSASESSLRETLEIQSRVVGREHPDTLQTAVELVRALEGESRYDEAEKLARATLDTQRRVLGTEHPDAARTGYDLACILAHRGRRGEAIAALRDAMDHGLDSDSDLAIETDPELKSLREDPRFEALVAYGQQRAATQNRK